MSEMRKSMRIGQMSKETGASIDAIRFYERQGLLGAPTRSQGGFRLYSSDDLAALQFIRNLQTLGFSLAEIREFLSLRADDLRACLAVRKRLKSKLNGIHGKRLALARLETELKTALSKCDTRLRHHRGASGESCPILLAARKNSRPDGNK